LILIWTVILGNRDEICENAISGAGYALLGATHSLPHPLAPAFVRPVDIVTGPTIQPETFGNTLTAGCTTRPDRRPA
jgi:hypothetical protein